MVMFDDEDIKRKFQEAMAQEYGAVTPTPGPPKFRSALIIGKACFLLTCERPNIFRRILTWLATGFWWAEIKYESEQ